MGTISDKLTYLNTTKTMLRDSLNKFGSNILTTDTFRSYDTKLNDIYDKLPKITQSGAGFTLSDVQNGQVDDFKMIGTDLEQDTTTGKNLFDKDNANIITAYIGDSYNWIFSGSAICYRINCKPNTSYTISCANSNETLFRGSVTDSEDIPTSGNNLSIYSTVRRTNNSPITVNTGANAKYVLVQLSNTQYLTSLETLQVEEGSSVTSYEPYTGGIPSPNPDYPQEIKVVEGRQVINVKGKNLFDKDNAQILNGYIKDDNGIDSQRENWSYLQSYVSVLPNTTYTISGKLVQSSNNIRTYYYDNSKNWISKSAGAGEGINIFTFTTPNNCYYIQFQMNTNYYDINSIQIEENSTATDYELYYNPVSYNIDLNLENIYLAKIPNTNYKNRIYKNNGNWYFEENVKKLILAGTEYWMVVSASDGSRFSCTKIKNSVVIPSSNADVGLIYCDKFSAISANNTSSSVNGIAIASSGNIVIYYNELKNYDATQFKTWLSNNNLEICYPVTTPTTTQITNTTLINQLEAISVHTGTNIITLSSDNNMTPQIEITRLKELERLT